MVREFMDSMAQGKSMVKQMIMGQGKTTVVGPLLALMLGDNKSLVCQVRRTFTRGRICVGLQCISAI
jgi:hypothetical protein